MQFELTSGKRLNLISQWAPQEDLQSWDQWGFTWRSHKCLLSWKLHLSCLDTVRNSHGRHRTQGIQAEWAKFVAELKITSPFFFFFSYTHQKADHIPGVALGEDLDFQTWSERRCCVMRFPQPRLTSSLLLWSVQHHEYLRCWLSTLKQAHVAPPKAHFNWRLSKVDLQKSANAARFLIVHEQRHGNEHTHALVVYH